MGVDWVVRIDSLLDHDISFEDVSNLDKYCIEESWTRTQDRSGNCSFRAAVKFCIFRGHWSDPHFHSCRVVFPLGALSFNLNSKLDALDFSAVSFPISNPIHLIIDGNGIQVRGCGYPIVNRNTSIVDSGIILPHNSLQAWSLSSIDLRNMVFAKDNWYNNGLFNGIFQLSNLHRVSLRALRISRLVFNESSPLFLSKIDEVLISKCSFSYNKGKNGGAIYLDHIANITVDRTSFSNNHASNIGGAVVIDASEYVSIHLCSFSFNSALSFGGALSIHNATKQVHLLSSNFTSGLAYYGSAVVMSYAGSSLVHHCIFKMNRALSSGSLFWLQSTMFAPHLLGNKFSKNSAGDYGPDFSTDTFELLSTPRSTYVVDYSSGYYPINVSVAVADFYGHTIPSENMILISAWSNAKKAHCEINRGTLFGTKTGVIVGGISRFPELGANCIPGGEMNVSFSAVVSNYSSTFPLYGTNLFPLSSKTKFVYRRVASGDLLVQFRRCVRGEIFDVFSVTKSTCSPCIHGYSLNDNSGIFVTSCIACPPIARSCFKDEIDLYPGMWRYSLASGQILSCPLAGACKGGNATGSMSCNIGYVGPTCGVCDSGYYQNLQSFCISCDSRNVVGFQRMLYFLLLGALAIGLVVLICRNMLLVFSRSKLTSIDEKARLLQKANEKKKRLWMSRAMTVLNSIQILSSGLPSSIRFPPAFSSVFSFLAITKFDLSVIFPVGCFRAYNFLDQMRVTSLFPLIVVGIGILLALSISFSRRHLVHSSFLSRNLSLLQQQIIFMILIFLYYVLPIVSLKLFQTFDCIGIVTDGLNYYLRVDTDIMCDSLPYYIGRAWAIVMVLVYPLGVPLTFLYFFLKYQDYFKSRDIIKVSYESNMVELRKKDKNKHFLSNSDAHHLLSSIDFLYASYKPKYYFWEIIEIAKKLYLISLSSILIHSDTVRIIVNLVVTIGFMKLNAEYMPLDSEIENKLNDTSSMYLIVMYLSIWITLQDSLSFWSFGNDFNGYIMIAANILLAVYSGYYGLAELDDQDHSKLQKVSISDAIIDKNSFIFDNEYDKYLVRKLLSNFNNEDLKILQAIVFVALCQRRKFSCNDYSYYFDPLTNSLEMKELLNIVAAIEEQNFVKVPLDSLSSNIRFVFDGENDFLNCLYDLPDSWHPLNSVAPNSSPSIDRVTQLNNISNDMNNINNNIMRQNLSYSHHDRNNTLASIDNGLASINQQSYNIHDAVVYHLSSDRPQYRGNSSNEGSLGYSLSSNSPSGSDNNYELSDDLSQSV